MGKIAKNYFYNAAYQILVLLTPIITAPYLARVLGADNLGIYSYVSSSGNIITTCSLLGIYAYGNRQTAYVRENRLELTKTFWELEFTRLILGAFGTLAYLIYILCNKDYWIFFAVYYPYILAEFIDCSWVYVGLEDMKPAVMKNFVTKLVNVVGIFVFVKSEEDTWIYIFMLAITTLIANISIYTQLPKYIGAPTFSAKSFRLHLKGSVNLFFPQVASLFYLQVDKVMLEWITGETNQVSFYDQAEKIVSIPLSLITVISTVMMPRIANEYKKSNYDVIGELLSKAGKAALCIAMPMMYGILCIALQFVPWYLGDEFHPTAIAIMILSPIVVLNSLTGISGKQYFTATNQIGVLVKAYGTAAIMNIVVNAVLIPYIGYVGAAVATVLSSILSVAIQYYYLLKQIKLRGFAQCAAKYFVGGTIMALIVWSVSHNMRSVPVTTAIQISVGIIVCVVFLLVTRDKTAFEIMTLALQQLYRKGRKRGKDDV